MVSVIILASFFLGAIADRLFVIKPLDSLVGRGNTSVVQDGPARRSPLSELFSNDTFLVANVTERVSDSVVTVSIRTQEQRQQVDPFGIFGFGIPQGEPEEVQRDIGSGFVVEGGFVVTNKHVVSNARAEYFIIDNNEKEYQVTNIYRDPANDLAILRVDNLNLPALALGDSDAIRVGEPAIAIGTALGEFRHTVTAGVISGLGRGVEASSSIFSESELLENVIQTDAAINPGNSGGPLLNAAAEVIGVSVATSRGAENIGFAIPINVVKASLDNFNETGQFNRPFLGVRYQIISQQAAVANEVPQGAYLFEVVEGSVADQAGLRPEDVITKFNGKEVNSDNDLARMINETKVGQKVDIEYWRDGQRTTTSVTLRAAN